MYISLKTIFWLITCRQLFALYETLPEPSVKKMEGVVNTGINIVASVYFLVCHHYNDSIQLFLQLLVLHLCTEIFNRHHEICNKCLVALLFPVFFYFCILLIHNNLFEIIQLLGYPSYLVWVIHCALVSLTILLWEFLFSEYITSLTFN